MCGSRAVLARPARPECGCKHPARTPFGRAAHDPRRALRWLDRSPIGSRVWVWPKKVARSFHSLATHRKISTDRALRPRAPVGCAFAGDFAVWLRNPRTTFGSLALLVTGPMPPPDRLQPMVAIGTMTFLRTRTGLWRSHQPVRDSAWGYTPQRVGVASEGRERATFGRTVPRATRSGWVSPDALAQAQGVSTRLGCGLGWWVQFAVSKVISVP